MCKEADIWIKDHCTDFQWDKKPTENENKELDNELGRDAKYIPPQLIKFLPANLVSQPEIIDIDELDMATQEESANFQFTPRFFKVPFTYDLRLGTCHQ